MVTNNKPQIRFNGFSDEWEQRKLGEMVDYVKGYAFKSNTYVDGGVRIVRVSDLSEAEIKKSGDMIYISKKDSELFDKYIINKSDIIVTTVGSKSEMKDSAVGRPIMVRSADEGLLNQNLVKLETKNKYNSYFIFNNLLMDRYSYYISLIERGNANQANITINDLWEYSLYTPNISEQTKIGSFFKTLDETISLHQQKLDSTKQLKKAMLQKMFPKKGENIPEIRFKGFSEAWEEAKLGDVGDIVTGSTPKTSDSSNYGGDFLFVSPSDIQNNRYIANTIKKVTEKGFNTGRKVPKGSILFVSIGTIGKIGQASETLITNQQINTVIVNKEFNDNFLYSILEKKAIQIRTMASTQVIPIINKKEFSKVEISTPTLEEQRKTGEFFKTLDETISLYQQKLDCTKQFKKEMLQKMFV